MRPQRIEGLSGSLENAGVLDAAFEASDRAQSMTATVLTRQIRALVDIAGQSAAETDPRAALADIARIIAEALEFGAVAVTLASR